MRRADGGGCRDATRWRPRRHDGTVTRVVKSRAARAALVGVAAIAVAGGGAIVYVRLRPDPAREMMRHALPAWQSARARGEAAGGEAGRALLASARQWPDVAAGFEAIDRAWPRAEPVRAAAKSIN